MPPQFSQQFEEDIKEEIKLICLNMTSEESQRKKKELLASLEAERELLLKDHEEKAEKIKEDQRDLARIHRKGVEVEEKIQQLKSGVFAPAEEPKKKVIFLDNGQSYLLSNVPHLITRACLRNGFSRQFPEKLRTSAHGSDSGRHNSERQN